MKKENGPKELEAKALQVLKTLRQRGFQALFAGGCVRDLLMGRVPKDYDIVTDAQPEEVLQLFPKAIPVGAQFGVVVVVSGKETFEVATFRKDGDYLDGRHPKKVTFSTPREDALRRDFTINGLFYDPIQGEIIDFVDGQKDLGKRIIRTIGDPVERFKEDKLRLMRAIRFSMNLGFSIEKKTWRAIQELAGDILEVSGERIRDELMNILLGPQPDEGVRRLQESGLLKHILPEVDAMVGVHQPEEFHPEGDVFTHTLLMLKEMKDPSGPLALGVLLHDVGKPVTYSVRDRIRFHGHVEAGLHMADGILRRLRFSRLERERVKDLIKFHMHFLNIQQMRVSKLKRFLMDPYFPDHLELHRLDCVCSHKDLENWEFCRKKYEEISSQPPATQPLVRGLDLIELGYEPGPIFSKILTFVEDSRLEGKVHTKEEALKLVRISFPLSKE